jgi:hypothetical protein
MSRFKENNLTSQGGALKQQGEIEVEPDFLRQRRGHGKYVLALNYKG